MILKNCRIPKSLLGCMECSSWNNVIECSSRGIIARVWPRTSQFNITLNIAAVQDKIRGPKICIYVSDLTQEIFLFMICVFLKKWGYVCSWRSEGCCADKATYFAVVIQNAVQSLSRWFTHCSNFFATYSCNYNHSGIQLFVSLSPWHVFINDLFYKKLSRSVKFQHTMNQVAQIYFSSSI